MVFLPGGVTRRIRRIRGWIVLCAPVAAAALLLFAWRQRVPPAYDERYDVLIWTLPASLGRLPEALRAFATHAFDPAAWGFFWPVTIVAAAVALAGPRRASVAGPLFVVMAMLGVYSLTFAVTSWNIAELAQVAASRLLLHLLVPACFVIAVAAETAMILMARRKEGWKHRAEG